MYLSVQPSLHTREVLSVTPAWGGGGMNYRRINTSENRGSVGCKTTQKSVLTTAHRPANHTSIGVTHPGPKGSCTAFSQRCSWNMPSSGVGSDGPVHETLFSYTAPTGFQITENSYEIFLYTYRPADV